MALQNTTMRCKNCVRLPLLSGPLSILICSRAMATCSLICNAAHQASSASTMKSLVLEELPKVIESCRLFHPRYPTECSFPSTPGHDHRPGDLPACSPLGIHRPATPRLCNRCS